MNLSTPFISRPIATSLLTLGLALAGIAAFFILPVAPLPQVDFPTINVSANMPGASPEVMAATVATPLERHLGQIADVTEMTSQSSLGSTAVTLQFGLDRDIDGAARDVQAAINAARADLPTSLRSNPTYRKVNPADAPMIILAMTSKTMTPGQIYDAAASVVAQTLSQVDGVGQVRIGGSSLPAVRIELNPETLHAYQIGVDDIRAALASANANSPKGAIETDGKRWQIYANDQASHAADYRDLIVGWRNGGPIRLSNVADILDSVEDRHNQGLYNGEPAVVLIVTKQPGSNMIETIDRIKGLLPALRASIPAAVNLDVALDRSLTIRGSLRDVELSLAISIGLVILVVFLFLQDGRAALVPTVAVPVSLAGTLSIMYLCGYSLDNLSLMALTISTGFVVDDAIVVLENIARLVEGGMPRLRAARIGARQVGFTVIAMTMSLIAVFAPILLMGGIIGRLFHEFAVTMSAAILVSLIISLTTTPMMAARLLRPHTGTKTGRWIWLRKFLSGMEWLFEASLALYGKALAKALYHRRFVLLIFIGTIALNIYLFVIVPKGFFPPQDTGQILGGVQADQGISFQAMRQKMKRFVDIVRADPAVAGVAAFTGGGSTNTGFVFATLKPLAERGLSADGVINRLRKPLSSVAGAALYLQPGQDVRMGGRPSGAQYQYTLQSDDLDSLRLWAPRITEALRHNHDLMDVNSDQQDSGNETDLVIDRDAAARLGLKLTQIDSDLYDFFGQRQVSVIFTPLNQYHVVMEAAQEFTETTDSLNNLYISTAGGAAGGAAQTAVSLSGSASNSATNAISAVGHNGSSSAPSLSTAAETMVPLSAVAHYEDKSAPLSVAHQGHFAAATISYNLAPGKSLSDSTAAVTKAMRDLGVPPSIRGSYAGIALAFKQSLGSQPIIVVAALFAVYIVLGILYESLIHPLTILSTLPSAGVGALVALRLGGYDFTIIAMIGIILLIGIVKKNAIMMIDVALDNERNAGMNSHDAIMHACLLRFRPIMMTTLAALLGALPLALGHGEGAEIRRPLGVAIVGGLIVSQALTLFTTPVVYLYLDRLRHRRMVGKSVAA